MNLARLLMRLAGLTATRVLAALNVLALPDFTEVGSLIIARANVRAASLADLDVATRTRTDPLGLAPPEEDLERLAGVLREPREPHEVERIAQTEPMSAGRAAHHDAMQAHPRQLVGWRRRLNEGACQLCTWWARDGATFPAERRMASHPNCTCVAEPVLA